MEEQNCLQARLRRGGVILDGAMGTLLQAKGMSPGTLPETLNLLRPDWVAQAHSAYARAGADILYANTFGASPLKTAGCGHDARELIAAGVSIARTCAAETGALTALDIGPLGQLLEPAGTLSFDEAYAQFAEMVRAGVGAGAELVVIETMTDLAEMRAALLAAKENCSLPVICTMSFEASGRTFTGCTVASMALTLSGLGADAIGFNCSLGPQLLLPLVEELARWTALPIVVKPNAGLPDPATGTYHLAPQDFSAGMAALAQAGASVLGGCCGTTPEHIAALRASLPDSFLRRTAPDIPPAVCSASRTVVLDRPRVIGERINPTGKKRFQEALRARDLDYVLAQGIAQADAGAELLDVNVGLPGINESAVMQQVVTALQGVCDLPLQIDSGNPEALESGLRAFAGKAIVNSVNGEDASLDRVLPLVKKYGAAVVGLTLDEHGIPDTAEGRLSIARKIVSAAERYGIPRRDVYIDCLVMAASAAQALAPETLRAIRLVKADLGVKTVLGVSNISFGLPCREQVNQHFLTLALGVGLDLPILNPASAAMMDALHTHALLTGGPQELRAFVERYQNAVPAAASSAVPVPVQNAAAQPAAVPAEPGEALEQAISTGLCESAARYAAQLLESMDSMGLVERHVIPPLDRVGEGFEAGRLFLPQLIQAAQAAQAAFAVIRKRLSATGSPGGKGPLVLATVKGDVHDIGKNIVKLMLENHGWTVIDLGRDVPPNRILEAVLKNGAPLAGLSALMTTTLPAMAETIALLHQEAPGCRIIVGGAVLTAEYAAQIGADGYSKNAQEAVETAERLLG